MVLIFLPNMSSFFFKFRDIFKQETIEHTCLSTAQISQIRIFCLFPSGPPPGKISPYGEIFPWKSHVPWHCGPPWRWPPPWLVYILPVYVLCFYSSFMSTFPVLTCTWCKIYNYVGVLCLTPSELVISWAFPNDIAYVFCSSCDFEFFSSLLPYQPELPHSSSWFGCS